MVNNIYGRSNIFVNISNVLNYESNILETQSNCYNIIQSNSVVYHESNYKIDSNVFFSNTSNFDVNLVDVLFMMMGCIQNIQKRLEILENI
jgi:hypothetical protein